MGILSQIFSQPQARIDPVLEELIRQSGGYGSSTGISVTPETALKCSAVYACVNVLAQSVAQIPLILYKRTYKNRREGRERATGHHLYSIIHSKPNSFMTSFAWREMLTGHNGLRGNSYSFISRNARGEVLELIPFNPDAVKVKCENLMTGISYEVQQSTGSPRPYGRDKVFHLMGMTLNGYEGVSPLRYARETIGLSLATEKYGAQLFKNGAKMGGILMYPGKFKQAETGRTVAQSFDDATSGENSHKTALLEEGMKWEKVSMTADDAQFLETRKFQIPEIARFYRMPLHKIQELERATFSNIEQQALEFVIDTLGPWLVRWEQSINTQLLSERDQQEYYCEFLVDGLLRGDIKSRYEAHSRAILAGFLNRNEVRAMENRDPVDGLDEFMTPTNMSVGGVDNQSGGTNNQN